MIKWSLAGRQPKVWEESNSPLVDSTTEALSAAAAHQALLEASPKADILIPASDDVRRPPATQLKSPSQGNSESLFKHLWRRHDAVVPTTNISI